MNIDLVKIKENEKDILKNLLEYYAYDLSNYVNYSLNENGKFERFDISPYFDEKKNDAFFIKKEGKLVGFILTKNREFFISFEEFWILPKYRKGLLAYNVLKEYCKMIDSKVQFFILSENKRWLECMYTMLKRNNDICKIEDKHERTFYLGHGDYKFTIFYVDCRKRHD